MARLLIFILLVTQPICIFSQTEEVAVPTHRNPIEVANGFIDDLANPELALDIILSHWVIVEDPSAELYDYLEVSLEEIRLNLSTKKRELLELKNYHDLPAREVRDIDPEDLNVDNMYFLYHNQRLVTSLYIEGDKIGSFTLVSKGDNLAHFVSY